MKGCLPFLTSRPSIFVVQLKFSLLSYFFIGFLNFAKAFCCELREFFRKTFRNNPVRMKILNELLITGFDLLIGTFRGAVQNFVALVSVVEINGFDVVELSITELEYRFDPVEGGFFGGM